MNPLPGDSGKVNTILHNLRYYACSSSMTYNNFWLEANSSDILRISNGPAPGPIFGLG